MGSEQHWFSSGIVEGHQSPDTCNRFIHLLLKHMLSLIHHCLFIRHLMRRLSGLAPCLLIPPVHCNEETDTQDRQNRHLILVDEPWGRGGSDGGSEAWDLLPGPNIPGLPCSLELNNQLANFL